MHIDADLLSHIDHPNVFVEKKKNQKKLLNSFDEWYQLYALISYTLAPGGTTTYMEKVILTSSYFNL